MSQTKFCEVWQLKQVNKLAPFCIFLHFLYQSIGSEPLIKREFMGISKSNSYPHEGYLFKCSERATPKFNPSFY